MVAVWMRRTFGIFDISKFLSAFFIIIPLIAKCFIIFPLITVYFITIIFFCNNADLGAGMNEGPKSPTRFFMLFAFVELTSSLK